MHVFHQTSLQTLGPDKTDTIIDRKTALKHTDLQLIGEVSVQEYSPSVFHTESHTKSHFGLSARSFDDKPNVF